MSTSLRDMNEIKLGDTITADTPPTCCNEVEMAFFAGQTGDTWACMVCECELQVNPRGRVVSDPVEDRELCGEHF